MARILSFVLLVAALVGMAPPAGAADTDLVVATRAVDPFIIADGDKVTGYSAELWLAISARMGRNSTFVVYKTLPEMLEAVKSGRANLAISAISITASREAIFDFSQPMFDAGLAILVPEAEGSHSWRAMVLGWSSQLAPALGLGLFLIAIPAHLIWFLERKGEVIPNSRRYIPGIALSAYWVATLMAGQADPLPSRPISRLIAVVWMYVGVVFIAYFTAFATSSLTIQQLKSEISGPGDLVGKHVATVEGSTAAAYMRSLGADIQPFANVYDAIGALQAGKAAAVVYDSPILQYYASHAGSGKVRMAGTVFRPEAYGILFPQGSDLRKRINEELLKLREDGGLADLRKKWFGSDSGG